MSQAYLFPHKQYSFIHIAINKSLIVIVVLVVIVAPIKIPKLFRFYLISTRVPSLLPGIALLFVARHNLKQNTHLLSFAIIPAATSKQQRKTKKNLTPHANLRK